MALGGGGGVGGGGGGGGQRGEVGGHGVLAGGARGLRRREPPRAPQPQRRAPRTPRTPRQQPRARQLPEHAGPVQRRLPVLQHPTPLITSCPSNRPLEHPRLIVRRLNLPSYPLLRVSDPPPPPMYRHRSQSRTAAGTFDSITYKSIVRRKGDDGKLSMPNGSNSPVAVQGSVCT